MPCAGGRVRCSAVDPTRALRAAEVSGKPPTLPEDRAEEAAADLGEGLCAEDAKFARGRRLLLPIKTLSSLSTDRALPADLVNTRVLRPLSATADTGRVEEVAFLASSVPEDVFVGTTIQVSIPVRC
mmetsp:Transcript_50726/g.101346  ORF Transcript_50726/g.101346 Transcript_50726/m.101346 type:complete len:127 (-) Transcript_50726:23-403(-)